MRWLERNYTPVWIVFTILVIMTWFVPPPLPYLYPAIWFAYLALLFVWLRMSGYLPGLGGNEFLCDSCQFNYGDACRRPERPNATRCPDYQRR